MTDLRSRGAGLIPSGSLWWDGLDEPVVARPALGGDADADVVIVGAGYTGLWTAHYLTEIDPHLRVVVLESSTAGFGASGRNGGWCSALFAASSSRIKREHGLAAARAMHEKMVSTVDEVGKAASGLGIDCHFVKGGTVTLARNEAQLERAREEISAARQLGIGEDDLRLLGPSEARAQLYATDVLGALFTPHCAAIQPARLVRGLASAVEDKSVRIFESSPVTSISPRRVSTSSGTVRAEFVVRATEGFTSQLDGMRRDVVPVYSLMVATEPLDPAFFDEFGLSNRQTFADMRHHIIYGQRTADNRIAFGGRGAPYHFGSRIQPSFDHDSAIHAEIRRTLIELLPSLDKTKFTHAWGGPLGITRDWYPSVGLDRNSGIAWAGGYVGDGVATTNLAGRTLADLILGRDSDLVHLPWVGHVSRRWEPEPLRWLGVNGGLRLPSIADRKEERTGRPSRSAALLEKLTGS